MNCDCLFVLRYFAVCDLPPKNLSNVKYLSINRMKNHHGLCLGALMMSLGRKKNGLIPNTQNGLGWSFLPYSHPQTKWTKFNWKPHGQHYFLFFLFVPFHPRIALSLPPSSNSDQGSHARSGPSSPVPTKVRAFVFFARIIQHFLPFLPSLQDLGTNNKQQTTNNKQQCLSLLRQTTSLRQITWD